MKKFFAIAAFMLTSLLASAQVYSNQYFSAQFSGPVTIGQPTRNSSNTSTTTTYKFCDNNVCEVVSVRIVDYDIPVDTGSAVFYRNTWFNDMTLSQDVLSSGYYEGHVYTYGNYKTSNSDEQVCARFIIVNSREAIVIFMDAGNATSMARVNSSTGAAWQRWQNFEYSLHIN